MIQGFDHFQKNGKDSLELAMKSWGAWNRNLQAYSSEIADFSKQNFEEGSSAVERLLGARTIDRAFEVQTDLAKSAYDNFFKRATKLSEIAMDASRDAFAPFEGVAKKSSGKSSSKAA